MVEGKFDYDQFVDDLDSLHENTVTVLVPSGGKGFAVKTLQCQCGCCEFEEEGRVADWTVHRCKKCGETSATKRFST